MNRSNFKNVQSIGKALANALATKSQPNKKQRRVRPARSFRPQDTRALPAAYATHVQPRFSILSRTANTCVVAGCDLVYSIPSNVVPGDETIFSLFPANPAYWSGTKIAQIAPAYMTYRPLYFRVSYIPQVAVTQQGTVFMGSLWNGAAPSSNIQQSLFTSNGGLLTQCYVPADRVVDLGRNLQQNLFTLNDSLNPDTCPFVYMAGVRGADVVPGYFYVTYRYEFRNPLGSAWAYSTLPGLTVSELADVPRYANMSLVILSKDGRYGPGTIFDYEADGTIKYHGTPVSLSGGTSVVLFANQQTEMTSANAAEVTTARTITIGGTTYQFDEFAVFGPGELITQAGNYRILIRDENGVARIMREGNMNQATTTTLSFNYYVSPELPITGNNSLITTINGLGRVMAQAQPLHVPWDTLPLNKL